MNTLEAKMDEYFDWLKQNYKYKDLSDSSEITTPFRNHLNDYIRIYLDTSKEGKAIQLSDDGQTLNELEMLGLDYKTKTREKLLSETLRQFNLKLEDDEIIADLKNTSFPQSKHNLIQGILKVNDLMLTERKNISNLFYDEVFEFLFQIDVRGTEKVKLTGKSGIDYTVDYLVSSTKEHPEMFINFSNKLDFNTITSDAYIYRDLKTIRKSRNNKLPKMNIIVNDVANSIPDKVQQIAQNEGIQILKWSDKDEIKKALAV